MLIIFILLPIIYYQNSCTNLIISNLQKCFNLKKTQKKADALVRIGFIDLSLGPGPDDR